MATAPRRLHITKLKLDERVVKILATLNVGGELDQLAMRGARYGFPGWAEETRTKGGKAKTVYVDRRDDAGAKAREYLSVAKTGQEVAGRLMALVAMARYADEGAVAQSAQSYYQLPVPRGLPWTGEIIDLIDSISRDAGVDVDRFKRWREEIDRGGEVSAGSLR